MNTQKMVRWVTAGLCAGQVALAADPPAFLRKVQLHNFGGVEPTADGSGVYLYRLPQSVREKMTEKNRSGATGAEQMRYARHSEIRFVLNPGARLEDVRIRLQSGKEAKLLFFQGDALCGEGVLAAGESAAPVVFPPVDAPRAEANVPRRFAPHVYRVVLSGGPLILTGIEGDIRPPQAEELPRSTMISYGTSITQGHAASRPDRAWGAITAQRLGYDWINLGCSGTAYCEPAVADYMAAQKWDLCTLEISVNMVGRDFSAEEFRRRATYLIETLAKSHPQAPIVCISLFPYFVDLNPKSPKAATVAKYRAVLKEICQTTPHRNIHFVSGPDLLSVEGLSPDRIHPSDKGMEEIASKLVPRLEAILKR